MINCGERPLRGRTRRTNGLACAASWVHSIIRFCLLLALLSDLSGIFSQAFSQGQPPPPDFHCLHVPKDQWHACIGGDLTGWNAYDRALKQYREQKAATFASMERQKHEERWRAVQERARQEAQELADEFERRLEAYHREIEDQRRQEAARVLAVQRQEEQARQAEQYRQLLAETDRREPQQEAAAFRGASIFLEKVSGGMAMMVVVLAFTPAYRLYATRRLMTLSQWDYRGHLIISAIAFGIFFWLVAIHPAESAGAAYFAALSGVVGLLAAFFLPGALLLLAQYVHYLFVPHPAEAYVDQARLSGDVDLDAAMRAGESMYDPGQGDAFTEWRLENRARRAGAKAEVLRKENEVMEELIRNQKAKARQPIE